MSWPMVKLGDVILFVRGVTFKPEDQVEPLSVGSTVVMRTKNVQSKGLDQSDLIAIPSSLIKRNEQTLREGDILLSSANSWELVGKVSYVPSLDYQATAGGFISIVRAKDKLVDSRYLYHWISSPSSQHKIRYCGRQTTNISNLDVDRFKDLEIPLPPLAEQKRIAAILDKADAIRRKRQQAIQLADDFLRAVFLEMFGDPVTNPKGFPSRLLSDFYADLRNGTKCGPFGSALKKDEYQDCGIPVWNMDNISLSGVFNDSPNLWISDEKFADLEAYSVEDGDVIISRAGTVGKMGVVRSKYSKSIISTNLIRVRFGETLRPEYFVNLMIYCKGRIGRLKTGPDGSFTHMNTGILDTLEFPYPPIELQDKYLNIRKSVLAINERVGQYKIDLLFESLSQKAFSGQL